MKFTKMHGCGNDYIYIWLDEKMATDATTPDCVRALFESAPMTGEMALSEEKLSAANLTAEQAKTFTSPGGSLSPADAAALEELIIRISDRHKGIGSDGVIFMREAWEEGADFEMLMYNADGSKGKMCGNGIRCVAVYIYEHGLTQNETFVVTSAGLPHELQLQTMQELLAVQNKVISVRVDMGAPILIPSQIPVKLPDEIEPEKSSVCDALISIPFFVDGREYRFTPVSMGNPHAVVFLPDDVDLMALDLPAIGRVFEHAPLFPERVNTEFVHVDDRNNVHMRVWERGSGETQCCGTGCCAITVAAVLNGLTDRIVHVHCLGGTVTCEYTEGPDGTVFMTGPGETVFEAKI